MRFCDGGNELKKLLTAIALVAYASPGWAQPEASASIAAIVTADPPRDASHPARNAQLLVPSQGQGMNALFFLAAGDGPKPTMILLHGLPGNERNLDLAQAVRRAGWNVLTFTYRGAWGSPGAFSIAGAIEDSRAALAYLREPATLARYGVDPDRVVLAGHSMGGFAAALVGAGDRDVAGVILLDAWNAGATGTEVAQGGAPARAELERSLDDFGNSLQGATPATIASELLDHRAAWNLVAAAPGLARHPVLSVYATYGGATENRTLVEALSRVNGSRVTARELASDHSFSDHRIALAGAVVEWLMALPPTR